MRPRVIGITGGPGVGKSSVCHALQGLGAVVISADEIARSETIPGTKVLEQIVGAFGPMYLQPDGSLDRAKLGEAIFSDSANRDRLNGILHPAILTSMKREILLVSADCPHAQLIAVEVPLLFEVGIGDWFDMVVAVAAAEDIQLNRLVKRGNISRERAVQIVHSQMPLAVKIEKSDVTVWNDIDILSLQKSMKTLWPRLANCEPRSSLFTH